MIPDKVMKEIFMTKEFLAMPCIFQTLALDAFECALEKADSKIVEVDECNLT